MFKNSLKILSIDRLFNNTRNSYFSQKVLKLPHIISDLLIFLILFLISFSIFAKISEAKTLSIVINSLLEDVSIYDNAGPGDGDEYAYIKFNISSIPKNVTINTVYLSYYPISRDTKNWNNDADIANANSQTWVEGDNAANIWLISTSNTITGIDFCNLTNEWQNTTDIKSIFNVDFNAEHENMTLRIHDPDHTDIPDTSRGADNTFLRVGDFQGSSECDFDSSEGTNPPKLFVTYTDTEPRYYDVSTNVSGDLFINDSVEHRVRWVDNDLSGYIFSWNGTYCNGTWYNDSWVGMTGLENWSNVTKTILNESCPDTTIGWKVYANDTIDQWNVTEIQTYNVYEYGYLEVELIYPPPTLYVAQYSNISVNATIYCRGGKCGNVQATIRYNSTQGDPDTPISITTGEEPFYIQDNNPMSTKSCPTNSLDSDEFCNITWNINATGDIDTDWKVGVLFNSSLGGVYDNHTFNSTLTILNCLNDISVNWNSIDFGDMFPNTVENSANDNSNKYYNISSYEWSCTLDVWIKGTNFENKTYSSVIGVGNMSWNKTDDSISNILTYDYDLVYTDLPKNTNLTTYYWFSLPPVYTGKYNGTITIKTNDTS